MFYLTHENLQIAAQVQLRKTKLQHISKPYHVTEQKVNMFFPKNVIVCVSAENDKKT